MKEKISELKFEGKSNHSYCNCDSESKLAMHGNCILCQNPLDKDGNLFDLSWIVPGLSCGSHAKVLEMAQQDKDSILSHRKLRLVLDLDETLIRAEKIYQDEIEEDTLLQTMYEAALSTQTVNESFIEMNDEMTSKTIRIDKQYYRIWIRPHLQEFMEALSQKFDIYIYTHATRHYAEKILNFIGIRKYIRRVWAREPARKRSRKRLSHILSDPNLSLVIDDKRHVWGNSDHSNVIRVSPFCEPGSKDPTLRSLSCFLGRIHAKFFSGAVEQQDVRLLLQKSALQS